MGTWGFAPWNDDSAADWFGDLFAACPVATKVEAALSLDPEDYAPEIRAAASVLIMLGRAYIWPIDDIDRHLNLAITQMGHVRTHYDDDPELVAAIDQEIAVLKSRLENAEISAPVPQPASWGNFWA